MPTTLRNTDILFNDGTTQSTAATGVPSSITAVGSIVVAANGTTSRILPGGTVAGSSLFYPTTVTSWQTFGSQDQQPNVFAGSTTFTAAGSAVFGGANRSSSGNTGWLAPEGHTALSGTWRSLSWATARGSQYDGCFNVTGSSTPYSIFQRIA